MHECDCCSQSSNITRPSDIQPFDLPVKFSAGNERHVLTKVSEAYWSAFCAMLSEQFMYSKKKSKIVVGDVPIGEPPPACSNILSSS